MFYKAGVLYTEREIREAYPTTSFPVPFKPPVGYEPVFPSPKPEVGELEVAYQDGTKIDGNGNRVVKWSVRDMFEDYTDEDGVFHSKVSQEEQYLKDKFKDTVPKSVSMRQARLALLAIGKLSTIDNAIHTLPEPQKTEAYIEWTYSSEVLRDRPFLLQITQALGMTEEEVDTLFIEASKL